MFPEEPSQRVGGTAKVPTTSSRSRLGGRDKSQEQSPRSLDRRHSCVFRPGPPWPGGHGVGGSGRTGGSCGGGGPNVGKSAAVTAGMRRKALSGHGGGPFHGGGGGGSGGSGMPGSGSAGGGGGAIVVGSGGGYVGAGGTAPLQPQAHGAWLNGQPAAAAASAMHAQAASATAWSRRSTTLAPT